MTTIEFAECKLDLLKTYESDLCEESIAAINAASTPHEFVHILHQFDTFYATRLFRKPNGVVSGS